MFSFLQGAGAAADIGSAGINFGEHISKWSQRTFRLRNDLNHDVSIECAQKNDSRGRRIVPPGDYYTVDIHPNVSTLSWCDVWFTPDAGVHTHFDIYKGHENSRTYELKEDGIYKMDLNGSNRHFFIIYAGR